MMSSPMSFVGKKFVIVVTDQIHSRNLAHVGALIGLQFGRKVPAMVGRDQSVPQGGDMPPRTHLGITTRNLPVLNGLGFDRMRTLLEGFKGEGDALMITEVTSALETTSTYEEYTSAVAAAPHTETNYWGIGVFGDEEIINKHTAGLKLYGKQPKIPHPAVVARERRLALEGGDLPTFRFVLANNMSGGELTNTAVILGVTYGKLLGDSLFGPDIALEDGRKIIGLPVVDLTVLHGHASTHRAMRELRDSLHKESALQVVDVTDATSKTRCYEDYLALSEKTPALETVYQGIGIVGPAGLIDRYTEGLDLYITAAEEQASLKKLETQRKVAARKTSSSAAASTSMNAGKTEAVDGAASLSGHSTMWKKTSGAVEARHEDARAIEAAAGAGGETAVSVAPPPVPEPDTWVWDMNFAGMKKVHHSVLQDPGTEVHTADNGTTFTRFSK